MTTKDSPHPGGAVAVFDLDGTLIEGGSVLNWLAVICGRRTTLRAILRHAPELLEGAVRSGPLADASKEALLESLLAGRDLDTIASISAGFADEYLHSAARTEIAARLQRHLDAGHTVVVASASPSLYVSHIAGLLGAHGWVATELAVDDDNRLTGLYSGRNCSGAEKLRRVLILLDQLGVGDTGPTRPLYAYGNARGDLRLLEAADRPVDVSMLGRLGRLSRFPRLDAVPV